MLNITIFGADYWFTCTSAVPTEA